MQINSESSDKHAIQSYTNSAVKINEIIYAKSLIVTANAIITDWALTDLSQWNEKTFSLFLPFHPKILLIGHTNQNQQLSPILLQKLHQLQIGCEVLALAAACRTFNILLSEQREVVLAIIFP